MTRRQQTAHALEYLGVVGATGMDLIRWGAGVDYRKRISELRRDGYNITARWERKNGSRFKRYFLEE